MGRDHSNRSRSAAFFGSRVGSVGSIEQVNWIMSTGCYATIATIPKGAVAATATCATITQIPRVCAGLRKLWSLQTAAIHRLWSATMAIDRHI